jgi:hypothetical protein
MKLPIVCRAIVYVERPCKTGGYSICIIFRKCYNLISECDFRPEVEL